MNPMQRFMDAETACKSNHCAANADFTFGSGDGCDSAIFARIAENAKNNA